MPAIGAHLGFEPGTSHTLSKNHTPRATRQQNLVMCTFQAGQLPNISTDHFQVFLKVSNAHPKRDSYPYTNEPQEKCQLGFPHPVNAVQVCI